MEPTGHKKTKTSLKLKKKPGPKFSKAKQKQNSTQILAIFKECPSSRQLVLRWHIVGHTTTKPTTLEIHVQNMTKKTSMTFIDGLMKDWEVPLPLTPGNLYRIDVQAKCGAKVVAEGKVFHRAVLVKEEMGQLIERARAFLVNMNDRKALVKYFYRNKPAQYYEDIRFLHEGVMEPYLKDQNGDQGSVINGKINGLFFSTRVDPVTGMPPVNSPFGDTRFNIPVDRLMHTNCNIYFADFYCNQKTHYVTLVITEMGSETDEFCKQNLVDIGMYEPNNPFLFYDEAQDSFYCCTKLWVEVFYTEAIDINKELEEDGRVFFSDVMIRGKGTSSPMGIPKNENCHTCNLYTEDREDEI